jgi:tetratricopeptide (TPR) repeat protein
LLDRSLIDFEDGEFWLHPVIRAEAISRLRGSAESEITNCKAARFWTDSIKTIELVEEAMKAMESYYHYVEINQFESASQVILKERNNTWIDQSLFTDIPSCTLGASLIRLGLFQQMAFIINRVIHKVQAGCSLSKLYNLLGDAYWLAGKINQSINCHEESGKIATQFACKDLELAFRFNIALCLEDLWEVQESKRLFEEVILHTENTEYKNFAIQSWYCLAHLCSRLGLKQETAYFVDKVCKELSETSLGIRTTGYRFFALGRAFTTLEKYKEALEMYQKSISYAEKSNFSQLKAITLFGLAELYRVQKSYKIALSHNIESIHILDKLGAKRHLGEAYYEIGLTYQAIGKSMKATKAFKRQFGCLVKWKHRSRWRE